MLAAAASPRAPSGEGAPPADAPEDRQQPLTLSLQSLASMHPPRDTSVLYAEPRDRSGRLLRFGEALRDAFVAGRLMHAEDRPLKLHATVLNTLYSRTGRGGAPRLDATALLRECRDFEWCAEFAVEKVAVCRMGAREVLDDRGEVVDVVYEEVASNAMPEMK
jgi:activating signal cointegrator complex subunit 1